MSDWTRADLIDFWQTFGVWLTGAIGAWFVYRQNEILYRQNDILQKQTEHMVHSQELTNLVMEQQRQSDQRKSIKRWSKNTFRTCGVAGLQMNGRSLRRHFPQAVDVILEAYVDLRREEPGLRLPPVERFVELMRALPDEREHWSLPTMG